MSKKKKNLQNYPTGLQLVELSGVTWTLLYQI